MIVEVSMQKLSTTYDRGSQPLAYDKRTKIVYIETLVGKDLHSYCPYYTENGKLCRFNEETQSFEEIG